jgi:hypothetical protein
MPHLSFACDAYDGVAMDNAQLRCRGRKYVGPSAFN